MAQDTLFKTEKKDRRGINFFGGIRSEQDVSLILSGGRSKSLLGTTAIRAAKGLEAFFESGISKSKARQLRQSALQVEAEGELFAAQAFEALNDAQASNIVKTFASGIELSGSAALVNDSLSKEAFFTAALAKANAGLQASILREKANSADDLALSKIISSTLNTGIATFTGTNSIFRMI